MVVANQINSLHMEFKKENLKWLVEYVASELAPGQAA
jgi:hypothetical protein